ncbi:MAG: long-chain fatty acid--CoA ligase [Deltaproteobacteria bacterium]|uniref:Long-chain fatty acid--CoA ligase n=1 Tax=Candidatus Zymogenus saltonus TaxID=2844893 RepID=A0A9D8KGP8_9DELT|nr:long-chain fatty acid--CoA ligase [Candidatus Zymogenus saltonus]
MSGKTLNAIFLDHANKYPKRVILKHKEVKGGEYVDVTWGELKDLVLSFTAGLVEIGVKRGDRLAILSFNRIEWLVSDLATLFIGCVNVPIYHTNTPEQCVHIITDSEAGYVVVEDTAQLEKILSVRDRLKGLKKIILIEGDVPNGDKDVITYSGIMEEGRAKRDKLEEKIVKAATGIRPEDMATIVYTSGTTGPPKGCMLNHGNITYVIDSTDDIIKIDPETNMSIMILPVSHFFPRVSGYYYNLVKNIPFVVAESLDTLAVNLMETSPTYFTSVPRIFEKVYARIVSVAEKGSFVKRLLFRWAVTVGRKRSRRLNNKKRLFPLLRAKFAVADALVFKKIRAMLGGGLTFALSAGAPLSSEVGEFIHSVGIQVLEFYGLTETVGGTMTTFDHCRYGTVGKTMPGFDVKLAPDGEILIKGNNFMGYHKQPKMTEELIKDGWCYSGDVGRWDEDGFLVITDRKKDLIITSGGKNISPQNLENHLKQIKLVANAMVYGDRKKYLTALITLDEAELLDFAKGLGLEGADFAELTKNPEVVKIVEEGVEKVNATLPSYETIKKFRILPRDFSQEEGEVTATLKIKRKVLKERYNDVIESMYEGEG